VVFVLCAALLVPVTATNKVYLIPQQSNATYCNTTTVEIWANASNFVGGELNLTYDSACANVTNWARNTTNFENGISTHYKGREYIDFYTLSGLLTGKYMIGTLTIHCNNSEESCETPLTFVEPSTLRDIYNPISTTFENGTFTCGALQPCLGTCCNDSSCSDTYATDMTCKGCTDLSKYWKPNKDSACFDGNSTSDLCLDYCPHCGDSVDNDYDGSIDYPSDGGCTCGLDPSEVDPLPPIPEASSLILLSIGLCALVLLVRLQRKK